IMSKRDNAYIWLSAHRALLGAISKQMIGICIELQEDTLIMAIYLEKKITEEEKDALEAAAILINSDVYPEILFTNLNIVEDAVSPLTTKGQWLFLQMGFYVTNE